MVLQILFLGSFLAGLVLAVAFMLLGVERSRRGSAAPSRVPDAERWRRLVVDAERQTSARVGLPSLAAFGTAFGAMGYLLTRYTGATPVVRLAAAGIAGGVAVAGMVALVAKWAVPSARRDVIDDRYLLQGHLARVTAAIRADVPGRISYVVDGAAFSAPARALHGTTAEAGTDVVIERIEDGCAYVEPWAMVEKRL